TEQMRDPLYGVYPGSSRLHLDAVPLDFSRLFKRTLAPVGSNVVDILRSRKELEKRFATLVYCCRAEGVQPPPILVLKGKPSSEKKMRNGKEVLHIDTRIPSSTRLMNEMKNYNSEVWIYWDIKFRT